MTGIPAAAETTATASSSSANGHGREQRSQERDAAGDEDEEDEWETGGDWESGLQQLKSVAELEKARTGKALPRGMGVTSSGDDGKTSSASLVVDRTTAVLVPGATGASTHEAICLL
jgi:hypothetical protein